MMTMTPMKFRPEPVSLRRDARTRGAPEMLTLRPSAMRPMIRVTAAASPAP